MEGEDGQLAGRHSLGEASVAREVRAWLAVVATHVGLRTVCSLQLRVCRRGFSWPLLAVPSVVPPTWTLAALQPSSIHVTHASYVDIDGRNHHL